MWKFFTEKVADVGDQNSQNRHKSSSCHQYISSSTSVTNIDEAICYRINDLFKQYIYECKEDSILYDLLLNNRTNDFQ